MFKKLLILSGMLVVVGWAFGSNAGREIVSYVKTGWKEVRTATQKVVPLDFEIKRAEDLLNNLDRADDKLINALAGQMQAVRGAERDLESMMANLAARKDELQARADDLKSWSTKVEDGKPIPVSTTKRDLAALHLERDFKTYKVAEAAVKNKASMVEQLQTRIKAMQEQREALKGQRADLATRVGKLKNDLDYLKVAQLKARHSGEDFQVPEISQLRELIESIEGRIETSLIEHQLREEKGEKATKSTSVPNANIGAEIDSYFSTNKVADKK
jgi:chromosome segregation ATPase